MKTSSAVNPNFSFPSHVLFDFEEVLSFFFNSIWPKLFYANLKWNIVSQYHGLFAKKYIIKDTIQSQSLTVSYNQPMDSGC